MVNIFEIAVQQLVDVGFYNFLLPFILFTTVMYAVLRKTSILGDSVIINAIISVGAGLIVFGVPVILGSSITQSLTAFMTQSVIIILVIAMGFIVSSFFYPNLQAKLPEIFKEGGPATWLIWTVVAFAAAFGLFTFSGKAIKGWISSAKVPGELVGLTFVLVIGLIILLIISVGQGKEVK